MSEPIRVEALAIAVAATLGVVGTTAYGLEPAFRLVLCLPLISFAPGYALVRAAAPAAPLSSVSRIVLGLGTSLAIVVLSGLLLELTQIGMTAFSWAMLLFSISMASAIILVWRSRGLPVSSSGFDVGGGSLARSLIRGRGCLNTVLFGASVLIVVFAFGIAIAAYYGQPRPGFTQFWIVRGTTPSNVTLGIRNEEGHSIDVVVSLTRGGQVLAQWPSIRLEDSQTWMADAEVPDFEERRLPLEATLSRSDSTEAVYRFVTLWPSATIPAPS